MTWNQIHPRQLLAGAGVMAALCAAACTGTILSPVEPGAHGPEDGNPNGGNSGTGAAAGSGNTGGIDPGVIPPLPAGFAPEFTCTPSDTPVAQEMKRLSKTQIVNALDDFMVQMSAASRAAVLTAIQPKIDLLPANTSQGGYTAFDNAVIQDHVVSLVDLSMALSGALAGNDSYVNQLVAPCGAGSNRASLGTDACLTRFIEYYGLKAMRRPATAAEVDAFKTFYRSEGLDSLIARLVMQPRFYYRFDSDGARFSGVDGMDAAYKLTPHEFVSKLTFLFWDGPPSDEIYAQAEVLDLANDTAVNQVLDSVLSSARAQEGVRRFYTQWLELGHVPTIKGLASPAWKTLVQGENLDAPAADHRTHMIDELLDLAGHYTLTGGGLDDLLTSPYSFAKTDDVAKLYGVPAWNGDVNNMIGFPAAQPRAGLLTRAAMLVAGGEYTRPVIRGKGLRMTVLCDQPPPPPPDAKFLQLQPDVNKSGRQILEQATAGSPCNACHESMNPLGFLTENYDSLGRYRTDEMKFDDKGALANRLPIDATGIPALFDTDTGSLDGGVALSDHIAKSGKADLCLVRNFFRFSHGRMEDDAADGCSLESLWKNSFASEGSLLKMLKELTRRASFRARKVI